MKTILVPLDFSDDSKHAMDYAILLAGKLRMKLLLLHAFSPSIPEALGDAYKLVINEKITGIPREMKEQLSMWKEALVLTHPDIDCSTLFVENDLAGIIAELEQDKRIDMIVMGTKGASGIKEVLVGSNTMKVISSVRCPVMAIPSGFKCEGIQHIAFATNYNLGDDMSIRFLGELAKGFGSGFSVLHVIPGESMPGDDECLSANFVNGVAKAIQYDKIRFHCLKGPDVYQALQQFTIDNKVDLFSISFTDRSFLASFFRKDVTRKIAHHFNVPFMIFHASEEGTELPKVSSW